MKGFVFELKIVHTIFGAKNWQCRVGVQKDIRGVNFNVEQLHETDYSNDNEIKLIVIRTDFVLLGCLLWISR